MNISNHGLVVIGSIGYDIYIIGENNKIIFCPGGFAWHCASGVLSVGTKATVIANITKGFNRKFLNRFKSSKVKVVINSSADVYENAYIFDFSSHKYTTGISYSEGVPGRNFSSFFKEQEKQSLIIHVGTTNPETILNRIRDISSNVAPKAKFSSNIYLPYLNTSNLSYIIEIVRNCSILFMNYEEFVVLKKMKLLSTFKEKLLFITCGKIGIAVFQSGKLISSLLTVPEKEVSAIGAGDVFIGACLSSLVKGYGILTSLILANRAASSSVTAYGTSHLTEIKSIEAYVKEVINSQKRVFKPCRLEKFCKVKIKA